MCTDYDSNYAFTIRWPSNTFVAIHSLANAEAYVIRGGKNIFAIKVSLNNMKEFLHSDI